MTIPVDSEGRFHATADGGAVVGEGEVVDGTATFRYGDVDGEGAYPNIVILPVAEFEQAWAVLPQTRLMTLAAGTA